MKVSFVAHIKPQPQGSIQSFLLPNKDAIYEAAKRALACTSVQAIVELITAAVKKTRAILTSDNSQLKSYRKEVTLCATKAMKAAGAAMADKHVPVAMSVQFIFLKPPSVTKKRTEMTVRPDIDKCLRSCLDACTGVVWLDDAQVVAIQTVKSYGLVEGVSVSAWTLEEEPLNIPLACELFPVIEPMPAKEAW